MTTEVFDQPETDTGLTEAELIECFAWENAKDAALDATTNRKAQPRHVMVLAKSNLIGNDLEVEKLRYVAVIPRCQQAGSPQRYATATERKANTAAKRVQLAEKHSPELAKIEARQKELMGIVAAAEAEERKAAADLAVMDRAREMLQDRLLPPTIRAMLASLTNPIFKRFNSELRPLQNVVSIETRNRHSGSGDFSLARLEEAERAIKEIEERRDAEIAAAGSDLRGFYVDNIVD